MNVSKYIVLLFTMAGFSVVVGAQTQQTLDSINHRRINITNNGMWVLGTWAVANMAYSGIKTANSSGQEKYFHQMNVAWNTVNLALAAGSLLTNYFETLSLQKTLASQHKMEKILLFNAGLDVAYMATGLWLKEKGKTATNNPDRFTGFGNSLLMQGGFLLLFDATFYYVLQQHGTKTLGLLENVNVGLNSISLRWAIR